MRVAITHDYLMDFGGAERVLLALHEIYPDAPVFTLIYKKEKLGEHGREFEKIKIIESWFGKLPGAQKLISPLRFMIPVLWKDFDLTSYDLIIDSASWAVTKGFKSNPKQKEICYIHTPPRYLYGYDTSRNWSQKWYGPLIKVYAVFINFFMRMYDFKMASKVDYFIANSENVRKRVQEFYKRDAIVIYPPVEIANSKQEKNNEKYFLTGGRLVAAKNFDLIIRASRKAGVNLKIFGTGVLECELKKMADETVEFIGKVSDEELSSLYKSAQAFIVAQKDEDFGITTVEAQANGCPVIAYKGGGYLETVVENKTGIFFDELKIDSLTDAIKSIKGKRFDTKNLKENAKRFSKENFKKNFLSFVDKVMLQ